MAKAKDEWAPMRRALRQHRLDHRWSWRRLAMEVGLSDMTVRNFALEEIAKPHEVTAHIIREYLARVKAA